MSSPLHQEQENFQQLNTSNIQVRGIGDSLSIKPSFAFGWLIDCNLTSSKQYFRYIHDDYKL
jgi:hypothetical protein